MAKYPGLMRDKRRNYTLRVKVPLPLRPIIGKTELWQSLGTADHREAVRKYGIARAEIDARFAEAERRLRGEQSAPTMTELHHLVRRWFHKLDRAAIEAFQPVNDEWDRLGRIAALDEEELNLSHGDEDPGVQKIAQRFMNEHRIAFAPGSLQRFEVVKLVNRALIEYARRERARHQGDFDERHHDRLFEGVSGAAPAPERPRSALTLRELVERYKNAPERAGLSNKTKAGYAVIFRALTELLGPEKALDRITRDDCRRVQDILTALPPNATKRFPRLTLEQAAMKAKAEGLPPLKPAAANSYLNNLASIFNWAVREQLMERNPAKGLRIADKNGGKKGRKKPFTLEQLKAIFNAPLYTGCENDEEGYARPGPNRPRRGRFWVPLLSLWTGMRLNECCQLLVSDVRVIHGIDCIVIQEASDDGEDAETEKRVKTDAGERYVPIHPELKRIGFMEYVTAMREAGEVRMFPELPRGKGGYYSDPFQKWFGRFLEKAGAKRPKTSFHSFRHTYRDALREADISAERARALGGWTSGNGTDAIYGEGLRADTLAREIEKIRYPGLDLRHLYI